jgi:hypothetical protein
MIVQLIACYPLCIIPKLANVYADKTLKNT